MNGISTTFDIGNFIHHQVVEKKQKNPFTINIKIQPICQIIKLICLIGLQCFDAVGWAAGRASGL